MALIQDIVVREQPAKAKTSPVKEIMTKLHLPHKKSAAKKPTKRDADLVDIITRLRTRK